ncbi:hypothetical protein Ndes2526B_g01086 [Nannochloris sp. 'desiccata']|nr:hypothetical protein NADE_008656 [Chlorella desiccata (nom. nud.)]
MQRPSRGPFALLGTAAALGVGVRAIKKARPFQAYNALNPLNSMVLPASLASFELAAESTYSNCPNCKPQFWDNLPIKELVICGIFFVGVVLSGQAAVAANIGYARIIGFTFAVGSATFTAASKLFGIEKETTILGLKIDQETAMLGLKIDHLETRQAEFKVDVNQVKVDLNQVKVDLNQVKVDLHLVDIDLEFCLPRL